MGGYDPTSYSRRAVTVKLQPHSSHRKRRISPSRIIHSFISGSTSALQFAVFNHVRLLPPVLRLTGFMRPRQAHPAEHDHPHDAHDEVPQTPDRKTRPTSGGCSMTASAFFALSASVMFLTFTVLSFHCLTRLFIASLSTLGDGLRMIGRLPYLYFLLLGPVQFGTKSDWKTAVLLFLLL